MSQFAKFFILLGLVSSAISSRAVHWVGSDIYMEHISGKSYKFTILIYRDCRATTYYTPDVKLSNRNGSGSYNLSSNTSLVSIRKISYGCHSDTACKKVNSWGQGLGIEELIFEVTVNFATSPYSSIANSSKLALSVSDCCRTGAITTGPGNSVIFNSLEFTLKNISSFNSPKPNKPPLFFACCNQSFYGNYASMVDNPNDSIVYSLVNPRQGHTSYVNYSSGFSARSPVTAYYSAGKSFPYSNPSANPPEGVYFDSTNADLIFTPVKCAEVTVLVIECVQYRKDTSGKYQWLSSNWKEMMFTVNSNCLNNVVPTIKAPSSFKNSSDKCSGIKCIDISTYDEQYDSTDQIDSLRFISVSKLPNGITFEVINKDSLHPGGRLCINPDSFINVNQPVNVTLGVADNKCKMNAVSYKTITISFGNSDSTTKVFGSIINDTNANCKRDSTETLLLTPRTLAVRNKSFTQYHSSSNGTFEFCTTPDSLTFNLLPRPWFIDKCGSYKVSLKKDTLYKLDFYSQHKPGIGGYIFEKRDSQCTYHPKNKPLKGAKVVANPGGYSSITDDYGYYQLLMPGGKYAISVMYDYNFEKSCTDSIQVISVEDSFYTTDTFFIKLKSNVAINISSSSNTGQTIIRGQNSRVYFRFENRNDIDYDSLYFLLTLDTNILVLDSMKKGIRLWSKIGPGKYLLMLDKLKASESRIENIYVKALASKYKSGDLLNYHIAIDTTRNKRYTYINKRESWFVHRVVAAFDPNEKRTAGDSLFTTQDRYLEYVVKFQNTGTAPAKKVIIEDSIVGDFNFPSIEFLGATHNYEVAQYGRKIYIIFDDINLPDSTHDPEGSQGSVRFKIAIHDTIMSETTFRNKVNIYFDFEKPVTTNNQVNTFVSPIVPDFSKIDILCNNDEVTIPFRSHLKSDSAITYIIETSDSAGDFRNAREIARYRTSNLIDTIHFKFIWNHEDGDNYKLRMKTSTGVYICFNQWIKTVKLRNATPLILSAHDSSICWNDNVDLQLQLWKPSTMLYVDGVLTDSFTTSNLTLKNITKDHFVFAKSNSQNACYVQSDSIKIIVNSRPSIQVTTDSLYCRGEDTVYFSVSSQLSYGSGYIDSIKWSFGDGQFAIYDSNYRSIGHKYDSGRYLAQALVTTNENCSDTMQLFVNSGYHPTAIISAPKALCLGRSKFTAQSISNYTLSNKDSITWRWAGQYYHNVESFSDSIIKIGEHPISLFIKDKNGCSDSVNSSILVTIDTTTINVRACGAYVYNKKKYTYSGIFYDTIINSNKCLNIIALNLKIDPIDSTYISIHSCRSYQFDTSLHQESGIYYHIYKNSLSCDSVVILNLQIHRSDTTFIGVKDCKPIKYLGDSIAKTGQYAFYLNNVNNCDSVIILDFEKLKSDTTSIPINSCQPFVFFNDTIKETGTYSHTINNVQSCDSVVILHYTQGKNDTIELKENACEEFTFNGKKYDASGNYSIIKEGTDCDTIFNLNLTITRINRAIKLSHDSLILSEQSGAYQWLNCSENFKVIPGENKAFIIPKLNGFYGAQISKNNCLDTSFCYEVTGLKITSYAINNLLVTPNPFTQYFNINLEGLNGIKVIKLYDCTGQLRMSHETYEESINIYPEIREGVYFLSIGNENQIYTLKIIKLGH